MTKPKQKDGALALSKINPLSNRAKPLANRGMSEAIHQDGAISLKTSFLTPLSLDLERCHHIIITTMSSLRTTLVALVTLAIAAFPLAGASAQGISSEPTQATSQADCENHAQMGQTEADHGQGHCSSDCGKCLCLGLMAVLIPALGVVPSPIFIVKTARATDAILSPAYIPPSPPPRA